MRQKWSEMVANRKREKGLYGFGQKCICSSSLSLALAHSLTHALSIQKKKQARTDRPSVDVLQSQEEKREKEEEEEEEEEGFFAQQGKANEKMGKKKKKEK